MPSLLSALLLGVLGLLAGVVVIYAGIALIVLGSEAADDARARLGRRSPPDGVRYGRFGVALICVVGSSLTVAVAGPAGLAWKVWGDALHTAAAGAVGVLLAGCLGALWAVQLWNQWRAARHVSGRDATDGPKR